MISFYIAFFHSSSLLFIAMHKKNESKKKELEISMVRNRFFDEFAKNTETAGKKRN